MKRFDGFSYQGGILHCEDVALTELAKEVGTPSYIYSKTAIRNRVRRLQSALGMDCSIYFAVKACSNIHILNLLRSLGCGADIVSGGELFRASMAQIAPEQVVFSGVGKSRQELEEAIKAQIQMFNIESLSELLLLEELAQKHAIRVKASLRVNPDVDAKTHAYISTGLNKNKFGLSKIELKETYRHLPNLKQVNVCGLSCHIGSQILSGKPFVASWKKLIEEAQKAPFQVEHLNLGGGLGISYQNEKELSLEEYGRLIRKTFKNLPYKISIEPGRALIGPAAVLLTRLVIKKFRGKRVFYIVDAAMNDLIRPALYGATHPVASVEAPKAKRRVRADLVGPVCETGDTFQREVNLPECEPNALFAFGNAGAYGMSMSSQYNSRTRAAEVLVEGSTYQTIRSRETYADLIRHEIL